MLKLNESAPRKVSTAIRIAVDTSLAVVLILLMATAIVEDFAHEWLGAILFVLVMTHLLINHKFFGSVFRGEYKAQRVIRTCVDALLVISVLCLIASSLVLSQYAFGWLPAFSGIIWARPMHMITSYWCFLLSFVHAGAHVSPALMGRTTIRNVLWVLACVAIVAFGFVAFVHIGIGNYLFLSAQFVYLDPNISIWGYVLLYMVVAAGAAAIGHMLRCGNWFMRRNRK